MSNGVGGNIVQSASTELVVEGQSELLLTEFHKVKYLMLFILLSRFDNLINKPFFHLNFRYSRSLGSSNDKYILWTSGKIIQSSVRMRW